MPAAVANCRAIAANVAEANVPVGAWANAYSSGEVQMPSAAKLGMLMTDVTALLPA